MAYFDELVYFLTIGSLAWCFLVYILYEIVAQIIYYRYFHPLRGFPGPFWASVTRLWIGWHCWRQTELETEKALHEKYGRLSCIFFFVRSNKIVQDLCYALLPPSY